MKRLTLTAQNALLAESESTGRPFAEVLAAHGCSYDSLRYCNTTRDFVYPSKRFIPVNERPPVANGIPCVSFFSGAGGMDIGFECAGFTTLVDIEINRVFCDTLRNNGAKNVIGPPYFSGDASHRDEIIGQLERLGVQKSFPGVFHGGPPCQSFSIAANQRYSKSGDNFKRTGFHHAKYGNLLFDFIHIIKHFLPEVFLIENVEGLLTIDGGEQVKRAYTILQASGYLMPAPRVVNAADYGIPQNRLRTIIIGSRIGTFDFPKPLTDVLPSSCVFRSPLNNVPNHITRQHSASSVRRYMQLDYGKRDHLGRVDRLNPDLPSKTIIAGGTGGGGRSHLHPYIPRTMSVRECARLQTFPDQYEFTGPVARQFTQVGNAVPPLLAYSMACAIYQSIYQHRESSIDNPVWIVSYSNYAQVHPKQKAIQLQFLLSENELRTLDSKPVVLQGTYRKTCRAWIENNLCYNFPITPDEYAHRPELRMVKYLLLTREKDPPLFYAVTGHDWATSGDLQTLGYPVKAKTPKSKRYLLLRLSVVPQDVAHIQPLKGRSKTGRIARIRRSDLPK